MYFPGCIPPISSHWGSSPSGACERAHERSHAMTCTLHHHLPTRLHTSSSVCNMLWFSEQELSHIGGDNSYTRHVGESSLSIWDNYVLGSCGHQCNRQLHTGQATSLWWSSTGLTGTMCVLRVGRCLIVLLIWNLHFESLHLQLILLKGKCLCIWLSINEEKYTSVVRKATPLTLNASCKCVPCLPATDHPNLPANTPYPAWGGTTAIQEQDGVWKLCKTRCRTLYN